ncbi:MAG: hypothetical protein KF861_04615 [Planctomycetaceae bacterium]|nr:hypothetical protein [Planctomycetaceae bacterium]
MTSRFSCVLLGCIVLLIAAAGWLGPEPRSLHAAFAADTASATKPVEPDMHEFMEYVFQPTFERLKVAMAAAPADNRGWKAIKADSLILAEGGNLLLDRVPDDETADWVKHSVQVRDFGGQLYRAAKAKEYATARKHYESMVQNCNACHHQFAGGEHILSP